jgi:hypothetical protein
LATQEEEATGAADPVEAAVLALAAKAPEGRFEREQRAAFRRALWGDVLPEFGREPNEPPQGSLATELARLVAAIRPRHPQSVEDLFVILHNAVCGLGEEARQAERVRASERQTWTRHRLRQAWALQDAAREAIEAEPTDAGSQVRIGNDAPVGDGWSADGTLSLPRLAQGPPGSGRRPEAHDERRELMRFLVLTLKIPVDPAAAAASSLLRIYLGLAVDRRTLREWWNSTLRYGS